MNLSLARVYLRHSDPMVSERTWQHVLDEIIKLKSGPTQDRWKSAAKDKAFDFLNDWERLLTPGISVLTRRVSIMTTGTSFQIASIWLLSLKISAQAAKVSLRRFRNSGMTEG